MKRLILLLMLYPAHLVAAPNHLASGHSPMTSSLYIILMLLALVVMIFVSAKLMRNVRTDKGFPLRVLTSMNLGFREKIMVIQVADKQLVIAVTPHSVSTLHVADEIVSSESAPSNAFTSILQQVVKRG